jgi:hypothetical protein
MYLNMTYNSPGEELEIVSASLGMCQRTCRQYSQCVGVLMTWIDGHQAGECRLLGNILEIGANISNATLYGRDNVLAKV